MAYFYLSDKNVEPPICLYSDSFKSRVDSDIGAMSSSVGRFAYRAMSELEVEHIVRETNKTYRFAPQKNRPHIYSAPQILQTSSFCSFQGV